MFTDIRTLFAMVTPLNGGGCYAVGRAREAEGIPGTVYEIILLLWKLYTHEFTIIKFALKKMTF